MRKWLATLIMLSLLSIFLGVYVGSVSVGPETVTSGIVHGVKTTLAGWLSSLSERLGSSLHSGTLMRLSSSLRDVAKEKPPRYFVIVWSLRLPRVLLAYLVGLSLASAGVASQALFKNPMADPYIIGVSGGASVGAALGMIYAPNYVSIFSFLFALAAVYVVYSVARVDGRIPIDTLLLAGVAFGFMAGAVTSYLVLTLGPKAHLTQMWLLGSFNDATWADVRDVFIVSLAGLSFLLWKWRELNLLLFGEESVALGLDVERFRKEVILVITVMSGVAVATSGIIGFIGLVGPHIARLLVGPNHRRLTINAALLGGILMVLADLVARIIARPTEIPVGIVTAMMGGPFFLYLLRKHKRGEMRL
ncbi:iron ABC transporter [Thermococcus profundus]|uniref:Iron ABC transporter n=1 Tax=Thermococcus profundus TaxID=49899 RepID=A0A2Z2MIA7_THEPR|nr:iron ABC transporter permease [Thermococcus profundus]ASJ02161.1 iron ABC transporter [Thermococcus profundus]